MPQGLSLAVLGFPDLGIKTCVLNEQRGNNLILYQGKSKAIGHGENLGMSFNPSNP